MIVSRKRLLSRGDFGATSNGGLYNTSAIVHGGNKVLLTRREMFIETDRPEIKLHNTCKPVVTLWDSSYSIHKKIVLSLVGFTEICRIEDFRIFSFAGKLYASHVYIPKTNGVFTVKQAVSEIDLERKEFKYLGVWKKDSVGRIEKNWLFFENDKKLYCIYSFSPYQLFEADIKTLELKPVKRLELKIGKKIKGFVSNSAMPINYDEQNYLAFIHHRDEDGVYKHWGVLINKDGLIPTHITKVAVLEGGDMEGLNKNVLYLTGTIKNNNTIECIYGEGDLHTSMAILDVDKLNELFVKI